MKRLLLFAAAVVLIIGSVSAQQFQWIRGGGTNGGPSSYLSTQAEATTYICSDQSGNVYALSIVNNTMVHADTFSANTYGSYDNVLITSYNCSGQMRWAKLIASSGGSCIAYGIVSDKGGHIYIAGMFRNSILHIGSDTAVSGNNNENQALIQFDTTGQFNWIRYTGDNTLASQIGAVNYGSSLDIDSSNNVHFFNCMKYGVHLSTSLTSHMGTYDLLYDQLGNLLSIKKLQIDSTLEIAGVTIDKHSNTMFVYGNRIQSFWSINSGDSSAHNFIAAFDTDRNLIWSDTIGTGFNATELFLDITNDDAGNLYVCGRGFYELFFKGITYTPPSPTAFGLAFIMKLDTAGAFKWLRQSYSNNSIAYASITVMPNNKIAAAGYFGAQATSGGISINSPTNYSPCFTIADTSGVVIALQRIHGNGTYDYGRCITVDTIGNLYIGGQMSDTIPDTLITPYHSIGGFTDFFVLKYGFDCSCTSMPIADYTYSGTSTLNVTYTGTITGVDSVVWSFGDGTTGYGLTASHTYTVVGAVDLCVTVYTDCGHDIKCSNILVNCSVPPASAFTWSGFHPVSFTYTGTTAALDSVVWHYGDGGTGTGLTPSHTYAATGTYTVCATVYTPCGSSTACNVINVACLSAPVAAFSDTGTHTIGFAYIGSTTALDSVVWNYGDGVTGNGLSPLHTYTTSGTYHACATAYTACGSDSACHEIVIHTVGISTVSTAAIQVYPNPAMNELLVTGIPTATSYRLLSVTGQCVGQGVLSAGSNTIAIKDSAPGVYILELTDAGGNKRMVRVVKG